MKAIALIVGLLVLAVAAASVGFIASDLGRQSEIATLRSENTRLQTTLRSVMRESEHFSVKQSWPGQPHAVSTKKLGSAECFQCHQEVECSECHTKSAR